jgi:hypothetical protein
MLKFCGIKVGNSAEFRLAAAPIYPVIAFPGSYALRSVSFPRGPDEYIDYASTVRIDQRSRRAAIDNVQAPTPQRKTIVREIMNWERKFDFAVEPSLHGAFIVRGNASQVARLQ